ncbi:DUF7919 family protein [Lentzea cavernae]|uniref:DUF7919 domain-containing protein n=1 Tax=Lentzea cavernae TaxID=2020703 RepID=A0ABQ3MKY6_9PSEU|nr:SUKH-3 domain-containing protein [Lentzea cavernae]GHH50271.1 hypothetical protein GCM10017774_58850 [Lentzea cavernae]
MTHYPDLSPYEYSESRVPMVNVGWLGPPHDFPTGPAPDGLAEALWRMGKRPRNRMRGFHVCEFCDGRREFGDLPLANGEIHVDADGVRYSAPVLVGHYVRDHHYLPPRVFVDAVLEHDLKGRRSTRRVLRAAGWEQGRSVDTSAWRRAFPGLGWHDAAEEFLAEFGGLTVRGREVVDLDPMRCTGAADRFVQWHKTFREAFPVGVTGDHFLAVDSLGEVRAFSDHGIRRIGPGSAALLLLSEGAHLHDSDD